MMIVDLILLKKQKLCTHEKKFNKSQKSDFALILFAVDEQTNLPGLPILVGVLDSTSIRELQITTDCSVFDRFCFSCVVCLFRCIYGQYEKE